jgi:hypothetical protein
VAISAYDTGFEPVDDVSIVITDAAGVSSSGNTRNGGSLLVTGSFTLPITIEGSKPGFRPAVATVDRAYGTGSLQASARLDMETDGPTVRVQPGAYTFTYTVDSACTSIPEEFRVRRYDATIAPSIDLVANHYSLTLTLPSTGLPQPQAGPLELVIGVAGNRLSILGGYETGFAITEVLPGARYLGLTGGSSVNVDEPVVSRVSMSTLGTVFYCEANSPLPPPYCWHNDARGIPIARCDSGYHRLALDHR